MSLLPPTRPRIDRATALGWVAAFGEDMPPFPLLVGRRGYYRDTMGRPGVNDLGLYDDAICLVTRDRIATFNANTDPSRLNPGTAVLAPGRWAYRVGTHGLSKPIHRRYEALVQAAPVTVRRHERGPDTGWFGINIHRGSKYSTSSEGCQTIHPEQWGEFMREVKAALRAADRASIPYVLAARDDVA